MATNFIKPNGMLRANTPQAGGGSVITTPVLGIVKNNIDPIRQGRIWVYLSELGNTNPDDATGWVGVSYLSPFFGAVNGTAANNTDGSYVSNPSSYGFWNSPPDIGTTVLCIFVNGDPSYGFYVGCVPDADKLQMVPAIGAATNIIPNEGEAAGLGGSLRLPVTNVNSNNPTITNDPKFLDKPKPVHSYAASIYAQQGLIRDPIRGPISSSASRESPSRVGWGVNTPGRPIYEGGYNDETIITKGIRSNGTIPSLKIVARRSGHSIVMDDGDIAGRDQLVRIRTALGHQILMSDDGQTLLIIHSNGQSYIELGKEGTIDMFSTNSVNVRTQGDLNFHADNNINMHAAKKFNIRAENIKLQSNNNSEFKIGNNLSFETLGSYVHKVSGPMALNSEGDASFVSSNTTFINGNRINLNTGSSSTVPKPITDIVLKSHTDTLYDQTKGFVAAPDLLKSITSRTPAHMPWADAGKGVAIKATASAKEILPVNPSTTVISAQLEAAKSAVTAPVTTAGISTVPDTSPISKAIDKASSASLVGAVAQKAGVGITKDAVKSGYGVVTDGANTFASLGKLAQTPKQLEIAGILKPGSSVLIDSLIRSGKSIESAMATNVFTGKDGATDLISVVNNVGAQVNAQISNFQRVQSAMTASGLITGKEAAGSLGGLILSGSSVGVQRTLDAVKHIARTAQNLPNNEPSVANVTNTVTQLLNAGSYAATLSQRASGGASPIANALGAMNTVNQVVGSISSQGITGASFITILNQIAPLIPNRAQDLAAIAKTQAERKKSLYGISDLQLIGAIGNTIGGSAGNIINSSGNIVGAVGNIGNATNGFEIVKATSSLIKNAGQIAATYASGVDNLPGGQSAISSIRDMSSTAFVPGTEKIKNVIDNSFSSVLNGIPINQAVSSSFANAGAQLSNTAANIANTVSRTYNSVVSFASAGLSANARTSLNSLTTAADDGVSETSTPSVGINTYNRSAMNTTTEKLLGDKKIPPPIFDSPSDVSVSASEAVVTKRAELVDLQQQLERAQTDLAKAKEDWTNEINAAIPNDARILAARNIVTAKENIVVEIANKGIVIEKELGIVA